MCVNNVLNLFAISLISVISFWPSLKKVGNCFLERDLDMIQIQIQIQINFILSAYNIQ